MSTSVGYTSTLTVDNLGDPEPVIAESVCRTITVYENAGAATTDYLVYLPDKNSTPIRRPAGTSYVFSHPNCFRPGEIVGYMATIGASGTFAQEEAR